MPLLSTLGNALARTVEMDFVFGLTALAALSLVVWFWVMSSFPAVRAPGRRVIIARRRFAHACQAGGRVAAPLLAGVAAATGLQLLQLSRHAPV